MKELGKAKAEPISHQFRYLLEILDFTENEGRILERIATKKSTAREIGRGTGIQRSHIHSHLRKLRLSGVVQESGFRPKRFGISVGALVEKLDEKKQKLSEKLASIERLDVESLLKSMITVGRGVETVAAPPVYLPNTEEFHEKAAHILSVSEEVIIGTVWPLPWTKRCQIDQDPSQDQREYWKAHSSFLDKTIKERKRSRIVYLVDTKRFSQLLDSLEPAKKADSIKAIIDCIEVIKGGCPLDFLSISKQKARLPLTTFVVGRDSGYFAISMADAEHGLALHGLFVHHPMLAEMYGEYVDLIRRKALGKRPEERLREILKRILNEVKLPSKDRKRFEKMVL